jgi:hypothetical protein
MSFSRGTKFKTALTGQIASSADYNQNFANGFLNFLVGMDTNGNFSHFNLGDETLAQLAFVKDFKALSGYKFKLYDSFGVLKGEVSYEDFLKITPIAVYADDLTGAGPFITGEYYIATTSGGGFTANYIYLRTGTGSGWSEAIIPKNGWRVILRNTAPGTIFIEGYSYVKSYVSGSHNWYEASVYIGESLHLQSGSLAISSGEITIRRNVASIGAETGLTDELHTINNDRAVSGKPLNILFLSCFVGHKITLKHNTGNLYLGGSDITLDGTLKHYAFFLWNGTQWVLLTTNIHDNLLATNYSWSYIQNGRLFQAGRTFVPSAGVVGVPIRDYGHTNFFVTAISNNLTGTGQNSIVSAEIASSSQITLYQINDSAFGHNISWHTFP